jgi:endonuclease/exonuclease/phosphatase family metal-dependent hydrolase
MVGWSLTKYSVVMEAGARVLGPSLCGEKEPDLLTCSYRVLSLHRRPSLRATLLSLVILLTVGCQGAGAQDCPDELVVMTFNIRYGTAQDGDHAWEFRRDLVGQIIADHLPDVLAIQEGLAFQLQELEGTLAGYIKLGQHRDGGLEGEFSGLYVKEEGLTLLDWGELWLSPTPGVVGSQGWDAALPRMAVWADIRKAGCDEAIRVYGTHFDHRGTTARLESARLLAQHARGGPPSVVMGDLNASEDSEPLRAFFDNGYRSAFTTLHPNAELGTFNGFRDPGGGDRIDHILLDSRLLAVRSRILDGTVGGLFPSDHFPVVAVVAQSPPNDS